MEMRNASHEERDRKLQGSRMQRRKDRHLSERHQLPGRCFQLEPQKVPSSKWDREMLHGDWHYARSSAHLYICTSHIQITARPLLKRFTSIHSNFYLGAPHADASKQTIDERFYKAATRTPTHAMQVLASSFPQKPETALSAQCATSGSKALHRMISIWKLR